MKKFIGASLTEAEPMSRGRYNQMRGWKIPADENPMDPGLLIHGPDLHLTWVPKDLFEKQNFPIVGKDNKVDIQDVENMIASVHATTLALTDSPSKTTVVVCTLVNGFAITASSACVDPANYDEQIGAEICMKIIKDKIWFLLGFLLQCGLYGFAGKEVK